MATTTLTYDSNTEFNLYQFGSGKNNGGTLIRTCAASSYQRTGFVRFSGISTILGKSITSAYLRCEFQKEYHVNHTITIYNPNQNWNASTCTYATYDGSNNWSPSMISANGSSLGSFTTSGTQSVWYWSHTSTNGIDVTSMVQDWADGDYDRGIQAMMGSASAFYDVVNIRDAEIYVTYEDSGTTEQEFISMLVNG